MFKEIYVKNFILINELHLDFTKGLSVFTGETGAGKSLLIDAISLLCGERANANYVAVNSEYALIEGVFELEKTHPIIKQCKELDIEIEDEFIVTRKITSEGKSSVKINHQSVTLSILKNLMSQLIDIHSQHDTQYLLNSKSHLELLDNYCHHDELLKQCSEKYKNYSHALKEYEQAKNVDFNENDLDYLKYQVNEIEKADLSEEKIDSMNKELNQLNSFEKINDSLNKAYDSLTGNHQTLENLYDAIHALENLNDFEWVKTMISTLNDCYYEIEENTSSINDYLQHLEYDENRVNEINEYLFEYNNLKRKYGHNVQTILEKKQEIENRINMIENRAFVLEQLQKKVNDSYKEFEITALKLSNSRKLKANELAKAIISECKDLYLNHTQFEVRFSDSQPHSKGLDAIEFYISMNPGEPLKELSNVASGGELSRLMLGLKTIFTDLTHLDTIIFDEIDTGVSGKVALAIGKKMRSIARNHQVFAITHLASVAACGHHHYVVEKKQEKDSTHTNIRELTHDEIISSLAFISSNSNSDSALQAASELYEIAQKN